METDKYILALQLIRNNGRLTRYDLARLMDVSPSLATKLSADLINNGLVVEVGLTEAVSSGRRAELLAVSPKAGYAVGLDIDQGRQIAVLIDMIGSILAQIDEVPPLQADRGAITANFKDLCERVIRKSDVPSDRIFGVGVGLRRIVDPVTGVTHGWHNVPGGEVNWENFPLRDALSVAIQYPHVMVDDVVRMLGTAEAYYGAGGRDEDFLYVLVDTGIGMAIMLGGQPYIGASHIAGEIGHIPITGKNIPCACGNTGCLEQLTSIGSLLRRLHQRLDEQPVFSIFRQNGRQPNIEDLLRAADNGDKLAYPLILEAGEELGQALAVVANLLGPQRIIVGGALSHSDIYLDAARRRLKLLAIEEAARVAEIRRSTLGENAGALGAATVVVNKLFEPVPGSLLALTQ